MWAGRTVQQSVGGKAGQNHRFAGCVSLADFTRNSRSFLAPPGMQEGGKRSGTGAAVFISLERFQCGQRRQRRRRRRRGRSLLLEPRASCPTPERGAGRAGGTEVGIGDISLFAHLKRTVSAGAPVDFTEGCMSLRTTEDHAAYVSDRSMERRFGHLPLELQATMYL